MSDGVTHEQLSAVGKEVKVLLDEAKDDLRREMRYLLVIGVAAGNVIAAFVVSKLGPSDTAHVALETARGLLGL